MASTTQLSSLKINVLTLAQYLVALENGDIEENELYLIKDEET